MDAFSRILNPHFVANILSTIQSHVYTAQVSDALNLISSFGQFYQFAHIYQAKPALALAEDLALANQYMALEKSRFGESLQWSPAAEAAEPAADMPIPPLVTTSILDQLLHLPMASRQATKSISLRLIQENDRLLLCAERYLPEDARLNPEDRNISEYDSWLKQYLASYANAMSGIANLQVHTFLSPEQSLFSITLQINRL